MTNQETPTSMKSIYVLGFPINLSIELLIQFISLIIPLTLIIQSLDTQNVFYIALIVLISFYLYPVSILFSAALITRLLPKPALGEIKTQGDEFKYQTLVALNTFVRRTPARWLMNIPFPGGAFYKVCGTDIDSSALVTFSDSLPDPYLVSIGKNSLLGLGCLVLGHYAPNPSTLFLGKVKIGDNVLIGAEAIVWANVIIGDGAIIQCRSVVSPGTIIPPNEIWGGIPAKKIRDVGKKLQVNQLSTTEIENVEKYIKQLLLNDYSINCDNNSETLVSLNLSATNISRILHKLEKQHNIFIDRTEIDIQNLSLSKILELI